MTRGQFSGRQLSSGAIVWGQIFSRAIILGGNDPGGNYPGTIIRGAVFLGGNCPRTKPKSPCTKSRFLSRQEKYYEFNFIKIN